MDSNHIISLTNHCLHLCNTSNIEETVFSYVTGADMLVTNDEKRWKERFDEKGIKCRIIKAELVRKGDNLVVDGSSLGKDIEKWEQKWQKQNCVVCIYNLDQLDHSILKNLVGMHDKMVLSINKLRMFSDKNLEQEIKNKQPEVVEALVKRELKNILISLLLTKPMCGVDLVKILYQKFKVFISPGMLYPTLHELESIGLLKYEYKIKNKIYSINKKEEAELLLKRYAEANSLLSEFLARP